MKNKFNLILNLEGATEKDVSSIIGCLLNEDVKEIESLGMKITFVSLEKYLLGFTDFSYRKLLCTDLETGKLIIDITMNHDMVTDFKTAIRTELKL